jgi:hypothetical protein
MSARSHTFPLSQQRTNDERKKMYFSKDVTSWIDLIDDGNAMLSRLKTIEYLLFNCAMDLPLAGCKFAGTTKDGYDGSEMLFFIDETLEHLIREYENQVGKYKTLQSNNRSDDRNSTLTKDVSQTAKRSTASMAA